MVELKKKVTLKTKVAETVTTDITPENHSKKPSNGGKKMGVAILLIVVAIVAFFLLNPTNDEGSSLVTSNEMVAQQNGASSKLETEKPEPEVTYNETDIETVTEDKNFSDEEVDAGRDPNTIEEQPQVTSQHNSQSVVKRENATVESKAVNLTSSTVEEKAKSVIRGEFGNGEERKSKLGSEYSVIQKKVNEMYANGFAY